MPESGNIDVAVYCMVQCARESGNADVPVCWMIQRATVLMLL